MTLISELIRTRSPVEFVVMTRYERVRHIRDCCVSMLSHAKTIRIQQVQATIENNWPEHLRSNADEAWASLNRLSETVEAELAKLAAELVS